MVDRIDQNVGRLIAALDELGELDNTIFVFTVRQRRVARGRGVPARPRTTCTCSRATTSTPTYARLDEIGGPTHHAALPARLGDGVGNTPFRLYKINTHQGGHSVPFIVSWPDGARRAAASSAASTRT